MSDNQERNNSKLSDSFVINTTPIDLEKDLTDKLHELRSKRDAVSLNHEDIKKANDRYNKFIIYLSLFTAMFETIKSQYDVEKESNESLYNFTVVTPIFLTTSVGILTALLKFKKFPEKMEELTKASEKCNYCITRIRELQQTLNFEDPEKTKNSYVKEVLNCYRDSLATVETSLYPDVRQDYYNKAQDNLIKIGEDDEVFKISISAIDKEIKDKKQQVEDGILSLEAIRQEKKEKEDNKIKNYLEGQEKKKAKKIQEANEKKEATEAQKLVKKQEAEKNKEEADAKKAIKNEEAQKIKDEAEARKLIKQREKKEAAEKKALEKKASSSGLSWIGLGGAQKKKKKRKDIESGENVTMDIDDDVEYVEEYEEVEVEVSDDE